MFAQQNRPAFTKQTEETEHQEQGIRPELQSSINPCRFLSGLSSVVPTTTVPSLLVRLQKAKPKPNASPPSSRPFPVPSESPFHPPPRRLQCRVATSPPTTMSTAISSPPESAHPSSSRAPSYALPSRSQSTRSRPSTSAAPATLPPLPHRAASHHQGSRQASSSGRPAHDILPHEEYANETTNVAAARQQSKRSDSRDRPPTASRTESASQPQRRNSQRSANGRSNGQPDMATSANNPGPAPVSHGSSAAGAQKHGRSRTTIPTQSGKWILGKTIGAGSMGKVKLAKKEDSNEQVSHPKPCLAGRWAMLCICSPPCSLL